MNAQNSFWIVMFHAFHFYIRMRQAPDPGIQNSKQQEHRAAFAYCCVVFSIWKMHTLTFYCFQPLPLQENLNGFEFHFAQYTRWLAATVEKRATNFRMTKQFLSRLLLLFQTIGWFFSRHKAPNKGEKVDRNDKIIFYYVNVRDRKVNGMRLWEAAKLTTLPFFLFAETFRQRIGSNRLMTKLILWTIWI